MNWIKVFLKKVAYVIYLSGVSFLLLEILFSFLPISDFYFHSTCKCGTTHKSS